MSSAHDHGFINVTEHLDILRRAFSTEVMEKHQGEEGTKRHIVSNTLNHEEMMKMDFYSKFTPTSVTLSHFLDHSSGGGSVEDSFVFLRREIPVRLANMMMELEVKFSQFSQFSNFLIFMYLVTSRCSACSASVSGDYLSVWTKLQRYSSV